MGAKVLPGAYSTLSLEEGSARQRKCPARYAGRGALCPTQFDSTHVTRESRFAPYIVRYSPLCSRAEATTEHLKAKGLSEVTKERWLIALYAVVLLVAGVLIIASL